MSDKQIKLFIRFIKDEGIYNHFFNSLKKYNNSKSANMYSPKAYLKRTKKYDAFRNAFVWASTIEGHEFWMNLDQKWSVYSF